MEAYTLKAEGSKLKAEGIAGKKNRREEEQKIVEGRVESSKRKVKGVEADAESKVHRAWGEEEQKLRRGEGRIGKSECGMEKVE